MVDRPHTWNPRLADGKPNLTAPAPRTTDGKPDFPGIWLASPQDDPGSIGCQPFGPRHILGTGLPESARTKIVQTPTLIVTLHEDLAYRQIVMDGRKLPTNPNASYMGYSVGRWEGEELVVESAGFKDSTWLDFGGHPHSEALHITERYRRVDFGHIQRRITLIDAKVFNKPITIASDLTLVPDTELLEYVCAETPHDRFHLTGSSEPVRVAQEILAKYVGVYDFEGANPFNFRTLTLSLSGSQAVRRLQRQRPHPEDRTTARRNPLSSLTPVATAAQMRAGS